jgi:hypothetical protein
MRTSAGLAQIEEVWWERRDHARLSGDRGAEIERPGVQAEARGPGAAVGGITEQRQAEPGEVDAGLVAAAGL